MVIYNGYARVRNDGRLYPIQQFVTPEEPMVKRIAEALQQSSNPIRAAHEFVNRWIRYKPQRGEMWYYPKETIRQRAGDCEDSAAVLCSILRNFVPPERVFVSLGKCDGELHGWVELDGEVLESTAPPDKPLKAAYVPALSFNDAYFLGRY